PASASFAATLVDGDLVTRVALSGEGMDDHRHPASAVRNQVILKRARRRTVVRAVRNDRERAVADTAGGSNGVPARGRWLPHPRVVRPGVRGAPSPSSLGPT